MYTNTNTTLQGLDSHRDVSQFTIVRARVGSKVFLVYYARHADTLVLVGSCQATSPNPARDFGTLDTVVHKVDGSL